MSRPNAVALHCLCVPPTDKMTNVRKQALKFAWRSTLFHAKSVFVHPVVCVKSCLRSFFVRKQASYMRPLVGTRLKWQLFNNYWGVTGKHTRGLLHSLLGNEWWTTGALTGALPGALTGALTGALSDSYSVTTEELLVNRPGHYCICYWVVISSK